MEKLKAKFEELKRFCTTSSGTNHIGAEIKLEENDTLNYMYLLGKSEAYLKIAEKLTEFINTNLMGRDILPSTAEAIKREAYDEGYRRAREFCVWSVLRSIKEATFNSITERNKLSKSAYIVKMDDLIKVLAQSNGVTL